MSINCGDFVRPNNPGPGLPLGSVWRVARTSGDLKLEPENSAAQSACRVVLGCRFAPHNFDKVVLYRGQWVDVRDARKVHAHASFYDDDAGCMSSSLPSPQNMPNVKAEAAWEIDSVAFATEQASNAAAAIDILREVARKLEAERQQELREAKAAKAKADKEAATRAKVEEARKALAAKLHADRCLGEATLELIAEVSRLNNGGPERPADTSIATHCDQLQPLARSYGYRIVKPSMIALVIKL